MQADLQLRDELHDALERAIDADLAEARARDAETDAMARRELRVAARTLAGHAAVIAALAHCEPMQGVVHALMSDALVSGVRAQAIERFAAAAAEYARISEELWRAVNAHDEEHD